MSTQLKIKPNAQSMRTSVHSKVSADTRVMTSTQSLSVVKTLIQTGIGVITYLRGVFPEECFNDDKIGPDRSESSQYDDANASEGQKKSGREGRGYIRVKHIKRGASKESDRVLDYLDEGAMDAIQRGFLRQLLFAMYLDPDKPRDVIECYTFNLTYTHSAEKSGELVPELEVRDQLREMSLGGKLSMFNENDPQQSRKTCGMVKRQVQALIKNLICSTQSLTDITGRRFLTFKLHYNDQTPADYEPPHFTAGDVVRDRFTFGTSGVTEVPSATEMGKIDTGFHSVRVALATISGYLPEPNGFGSKIVTNGRSADEVHELELKKVREEAKERDIVWDTEQILAPSPPLTPSGFKKPDCKTLAQPIGKRDPTGCIFPLDEDAGQQDENIHPFKILKRKSTPKNDLSSENIPLSNLTQTEVQSQFTPLSAHQDTYAPDSRLKITRFHNNFLESETVNTQKKIENLVEDKQQIITGAEKDNFNKSSIKQGFSGLGSRSEIQKSVESWDDLIDETRIPTPELTNSFKKLIENSSNDSYDPIESYSSNDGFSKLKDLPLTDFLQKSKSKQSKDVLSRKKGEAFHHDSKKKIKRFSKNWPSGCNKSGICECQDANDDQDMIGCEICKRWRHLNCYGYKSVKDSRIPDFFICFRCRIHKGMELEEMWRREDDIKIALEGLRGLCIFRRTLNIIYQEGLPPVLKDLALRLEVDLPTASQIRNRLESEKFICLRSNYRATSSGIWESERKSSKKSKRPKPSIKSMVVNQSYEQKKLKDKLYFTPGTGTEAELLEKLHKVKENNVHDDAVILNDHQQAARIDASSSPLLHSLPDVQTSDNNEIHVTVDHEIIPAKPTVADNNSGEDIRETLPANMDDVIMQDGSQDNHSVADQAEVIPSAVTVKNKVSIGVEELEVLGVTWDDFDE